ncbi:reverse transcriptase domain-containing protein, partial [Tanacetum coccineum]
GGGRTRGLSSNQGDGRIDGQDDQVGAQVGDQGRGQGNGRNQNDDAVNDNIQGDVSRGCTYKEFLAYNPKEYDGKGGAIKYTRWIEKVESVQAMSGCRDNQKNHAMVGAGHAAYTDRFHELARLVPHLVTPKGKRIERYVYGLAPQIQGMVAATEPKTIQKAVQIAGTLTDEALRNGSIKKNPEKRGNGGEPSKDRNVRDDNKRTRTGNAFATTTNPVGRENTGTVPKCTTCNTHHLPGAPCRTCFNCNRPGHFAKDCRVVPRNVNPINARNPTVRACYEYGSTDQIKSACPRLNQAQRPGVNPHNQVVIVNGGQGRGNQGNQARGRAFMLGAEKARQDPNIVTGIEANDLGFSNVIEIASGQLVEIDKKVVRIPLLDGNVLSVLGERPEEKARHLLSAKAKEQKQEEMAVVRDFPEVFPDDLSRLPPIREIKFLIELVLETNKRIAKLSSIGILFVLFLNEEVVGLTQRTPG